LLENRFIVVPDDLRHNVMLVDWAGHILWSVEPGAELGAFGDVALSRGKVYISFESTRRISVYDLQGQPVTSVEWPSWSARPENAFSVERIWVGDSGNVYCLETVDGDERLVSLDTHGRFLGALQGSKAYDFAWVTGDGDVLCLGAPSGSGPSTRVEIIRLRFDEESSGRGPNILQLPLKAGQSVSRIEIIGVGNDERVYLAFRVKVQAGPGEFLNLRHWTLAVADTASGSVSMARLPEFVHAARWRPRVFRVGPSGKIYFLASASSKVPPDSPIRYEVLAVEPP